MIGSTVLFGLLTMALFICSNGVKAEENETDPHPWNLFANYEKVIEFPAHQTHIEFLTLYTNNSGPGNLTLLFRGEVETSFELEPFYRNPTEVSTERYGMMNYYLNLTNEAPQKAKLTFNVSVVDWSGSEPLVKFKELTLNITIPQVNFSSKISKQALELNVKPGATGSGRFQLEIENSGEAILTLFIYPHAKGLVTNPRTWVTSVEPGNVSFINFTISALPKSASRDIDLYLFLNTSQNDYREHYDIENSPYDELIVIPIHIIPYARVSVTPEQPFIKVKPGSERPIYFRVFNSGNSPQTFRVELKNEVQLRQEGFSFYSQWEDLTIDKDSFSKIILIVKFPRDVKDDYFTLEVMATSIGLDLIPENNDFRSGTVTIWVRGGISELGPPVPLALGLIVFFLAVLITSAMKSRGKKEK